MREEDYRGSEEARLWFRARTNCLWLGDRQRERVGGCQVCGGAMREDLKHFVLECGRLEEERATSVELQRPRVEDEDEVIGTFLFDETRREAKMRTMKRMWYRRKNILTE